MPFMNSKHFHSQRISGKCLLQILDFILAHQLIGRYEAFHQDLDSKITDYPQNVLKELISYSACISRYFNVKETYEGVSGKSVYSF